MLNSPFNKIAAFLMPLTLAIGVKADAQRHMRIDPRKACYWSGTRSVASTITVWESDEEAKDIERQILSYIGLHPNFDFLRSDQVTNAMATIRDGVRVVLYNQGFIQNISDNTGTYWASISILAHEIGHHLEGHSLTLASSIQSFREELEADEFSGFILAKMHATLQQAQSAVKTLNPHDEFKSYHPPRSERLESIQRGWEKGSKDGPDNESTFQYSMLARYKTLTDENFCEILSGIIKCGANDFADIIGPKVESGTLFNYYTTRFSFNNCHARVQRSMIGSACVLTFYTDKPKETAHQMVLHYVDLIEACTGKSTFTLVNPALNGGCIATFLKPVTIKVCSRQNDSGKWRIEIQISNK